MVRITGVEPAPSCPDWHLKPARLPIPPYPHIALLLYHVFYKMSIENYKLNKKIL